MLPTGSNVKRPTQMGPPVQNHLWIRRWLWWTHEAEPSVVSHHCSFFFLFSHRISWPRTYAPCAACFASTTYGCNLQAVWQGEAFASRNPRKYESTQEFLHQAGIAKANKVQYPGRAGHPLKTVQVPRWATVEGHLFPFHPSLRS